jgi:hypothetical protein
MNPKAPKIKQGTPTPREKHETHRTPFNARHIPEESKQEPAEGSPEHSSMKGPQSNPGRLLVPDATTPTNRTSEDTWVFYAFKHYPGHSLGNPSFYLG